MWTANKQVVLREGSSPPEVVVWNVFKTIVSELREPTENGVSKFLRGPSDAASLLRYRTVSTAVE